MLLLLMMMMLVMMMNRCDVLAGWLQRDALTRDVGGGGVGATTAGGSGTPSCCLSGPYGSLLGSSGRFVCL
jgi:hypothetical protein